MTPVDQTTFGPEGGNCFSACVASILEIPITQVPFFMEPDEWWPGFVEWCRRRGVAAQFYYADEHVPAGYSIAGGYSPTDPMQGHACVAHDGDVIYDPHPARLGLGVIDRYIVLEKMP